MPTAAATEDTRTMRTLTTDEIRRYIAAVNNGEYGGRENSVWGLSASNAKAFEGYWDGSKVILWTSFTVLHHSQSMEGADLTP